MNKKEKYIELYHMDKKKRRVNRYLKKIENKWL